MEHEMDAAHIKMIYNCSGWRLRLSGFTLESFAYVLAHWLFYSSTKIPGNTSTVR